MTKEEIKQLVGENPLILEIGCADGTDTKELMKIGTVYGFEPEPKNIAILETIKGINLFQGAVGNSDSQVVFNRSSTDNPNALSLSGSIMKPKNHLKRWDWIFFKEQLVVNCVRLDTFCKDMPLIDFIWCDAQGAEEQIILGGSETLKKTRYFYTEYGNDEQYQDQPTLERILGLLPNFEIVKDYKTDILLRNKKL